MEPILVNGQWAASKTGETIQAVNPNTGQKTGPEYPVSGWTDLEPMAVAAAAAFAAVRDWPGERFAAFLDAAAAKIDDNADAIAAAAQEETGLGYEPRLRVGEMGRTVGQLRQAAAAARESSWRLPTIDTTAGVRSMHVAMGPVFVIGPNNFPLAFNAISGGDFAAAIAAGCPVIAKGHPAHPRTSQLLGEAVFAAAEETGMPPGMVQLFYHCSPDVGLQLIQHPAIAAIAFTGSRAAGMSIKATADRLGKPAFLEMSSLNPVVLLGGALASRGEEIVDQFLASSHMGGGQFCTNPGLVVIPSDAAGEQFLTAAGAKVREAACPTMLGPGVVDHYKKGIDVLKQTGAEVAAEATCPDDERLTTVPTLLTVDGATFLEHAALFQTEVFGPCALVVKADDTEQMAAILERLEGNLTGCFYADDADQATYERLEPILRRKVGRLLNDQMPTGVAVSAAMNHGGPYPATGHPGFSAVGLPGSARRFSILASYDNVRDERLPAELRDHNAGGYWRLVDGVWTTDDVAA